jgi:16S rRNA (uracil1498-N3)-methyltransferase
MCTIAHGTTMNICLFTPEEITRPLQPHDERSEHIRKVLRKSDGDTFDAGIIGGMAGTATIIHIATKDESDPGTITFSFKPESDGKPLYPLTLIIGFPRPIQLRRLLRDVAGLGAAAVHLTGTELGEKSYLQSTVVEHGAAYRMLLDGTAQAAGTKVPELFMHETLQSCLASLPEHARRIALDNEQPPVSLHACLMTVQEPQPVIAAIGSERGWSDHERQILEQAGFTRCGMGCRILRTETAATVAAALILDSFGVLA